MVVMDSTVLLLLFQPSAKPSLDPATDAVKPLQVDAMLQAIVRRGAPTIANDVLRWTRRIFDYYLYSIDEIHCLIIFPSPITLATLAFLTIRLLVSASAADSSPIPHSRSTSLS